MKKQTRPKVDIYTDGACSGNPGNGGWGVVLIYGENQKQLSGGEVNTTNNQMELLACIKALEALKVPCDVDLYSDSAYVVNTFLEGWLEEWKQMGWRTKGKKEVFYESCKNDKHRGRFHSPCFGSSNRPVCILRKKGSQD